MDGLEKLVIDADITVSLLPYTHHVTVAELCIKHKKPMVTTSYVSDAMKALDARAKKLADALLSFEQGDDKKKKDIKAAVETILDEPGHS